MTSLFNAVEYLALYPTLAEHGLNTDTVYAAHYVPYGAAELRAPNAALVGAFHPDSVLAYANGNPALAQHLGINVPATVLSAEHTAQLVLHYVQYGHGEDRVHSFYPMDTVADPPASDLAQALVALQHAEANLAQVIGDIATALQVDPHVGAINYQFTMAELALMDIVASIPDNFLGHYESLQQAVLAAVELQQQSKLDLLALGFNPLEHARVLQWDRAQTRLDQAESDVLTAELQVGLQVARVQAHNSAKHDGLTVVLQFDGTVHIQTTEMAADVAVLRIDDGKLIIDAHPDHHGMIKSLSSYDTLIQALHSLHTHHTELQQATTAFNTAKAHIDELGLLTKATAWSQAHKEAAVINQSLTEFTTALEYKATLYDALNTAQNAASYVSMEFGIKPVVLGDHLSTASATWGDDLLLYTDSADAIEVFSFGYAGDDRIFFGEQYSWTVLAADADIAKTGNGDRDVLEVFAQQQGADVVLYVETDAAGGTVSGVSNIDTITLVGVNIDDVDFSSGFVQGAVAV